MLPTSPLHNFDHTHTFLVIPAYKNALHWKEFEGQVGELLRHQILHDVVGSAHGMYLQVLASVYPRLRHIAPPLRPANVRKCRTVSMLRL